jgi:hypothetical protein
MRFVFALLAACVLLLSFTNGAAANAANSPEPTGVEMLTHHEGDGDEAPDCPMATGSHHHHSTIGEHQMALPDAALPMPNVAGLNSILAQGRDFLPPGLNPASEPHPPKA